MRQTRTTWFIISSLLGLLFIIWGAIANPRPLVPGDSWLVLPGLLLFAIGLFGILDDFLVDRQVKKLISSRVADGKSIVEIAEIVNRDENNIREVVMTLRAKGEITKYFNPSTGFLVSSQIKILYQLRKRN
jgi:UDP-N-acetylmuramyl pentapeptide phosphotransferase/UDP-N-acetylglucosamine-1-phosphate transferase